MESVFIAPLDGRLDASVLPETRESRKTFDRHGLAGVDFGISSDELGESLQSNDNISPGHSLRRNRRQGRQTSLLWFWKATPCSSMALKMTWKAWTKFVKMTTRHCLRSLAVKPPAYSMRICLRTVDLPLSPAPVVISSAGAEYARAVQVRETLQAASLTEQQYLYLARNSLPVLTEDLFDFLVPPRTLIFTLLLLFPEAHFDPYFDGLNSKQRYG